MKELHLLALDYRCAVLPDDAHEAWIELEKYVKQLINEEREACAKVCDEKVDAEYATGKVDHNEMGWTQYCAMAIRLREKSNEQRRDSDERYSPDA